jgi:transposase
MCSITAVRRLDDQVILSVQSGKPRGACPGCQVSKPKLHSYYTRKIKDLTAFDHKVSLHIRARKGYCQNMECTRKIFTESFEHFVQRYKRFSERLREKLLNIAILTGGNAGERLSNGKCTGGQALNC